ncbi:MAG: RecB-family nuclease [Fervidicoccaceae archaeon]|jgi:SpoU rRNA methylase family enzyme|nr:RecB-family nuclease [Fervidicoccaceae archaeon]
MDKLIVVLHDASSQARINNFIKVILAFTDKVSLVVISKPSGAGAMYGVPEASKLLYKESMPLIVVPDLKDLREVFPNKKLVLVALDEEKSRRIRTLSELGDPSDKLLVFPGSDGGFSKKELLEADDIVYPLGLKREVPAEALLAVLLSSLS